MQRKLYSLLLLGTLFMTAINYRTDTSAKEVNVFEKREHELNITTYKSDLIIQVPLKKRVKFHITYYTNKNNRLQGGKYDKKSNLLTSHNYPVLALPKDVPYGTKVEFDEEVSGSKEYINVDTGGAIKWLNSDKTECKVDIFIPNVSERWLMNNADNKIVYGWIVYKE